MGNTGRGLGAWGVGLRARKPEDREPEAPSPVTVSAVDPSQQWLTLSSPGRDVVASVLPNALTPDD